MKWGARPLVLLCWASFSIHVFAASYCGTVQGGSYRYVGCNLSVGSLSQLSVIYIHTNGVGFFYYNYDDLDLVWGPTFPPQLTRGEGAVALVASGGGHQICFNEPTTPPKLPLHLYPGLNLISCQSNMVAQFEDIVGRAPEEGARLARYVGGSSYDPFWDFSTSSPFEATNFVSYLYRNGAWQPSVPTAAIGEAVYVSEPAVFVYQPVALNPRIAGGNFAFEVETVYGKSVTIEVADALPPSLPPSWQELTTFIGDGHRKTVLDPVDSGGSAQKYYRIKSTAP